MLLRYPSDDVFQSNLQSNLTLIRLRNSSISREGCIRSSKIAPVLTFGFCVVMHGC